MYLTLGYLSFFKIHLGYIHDTFQYTMYLNPQIHVTQDTLTIHVGYIGIHSRIRISSPTVFPPPLRKHDIKKLRQAKVPWGSKKPAHG